MSSLGTDGGGSTHNTVSGDAVIVGPLLMAQRIEGIHLPPAPPDAPPSQGPPPSRVFVNRTKELADLRDGALALAAEEEPGTLLVVGVGGVGKTQLVAQCVGRDLKQLFPDGQLYVDLEDHRRDGAVDLAAVLGGFLRALGVHKDYVPGPLAERTALFRSVAAPLRLLVKVDNVQHAPEARTLVPPRGLLVVTGRRVLPSLLMDGAVLIDVAPLDEAAGFERALAANRAVPDQHGVVVQSYNVAQALVAGERWTDALDVLDEAAETARTTGDEPMLPRIDLVRAHAFAGLGALDRAVTAAGSAADRAAALKQFAKLDQALELLTALADRAEDRPLRAACEEKLRALRRTMGMKPPAAPTA
ncbi:MULTISPECIES: hypothetical protein [unclassified Streptomyces]|uniref:hypothetical protein n=1 Tax=unclassified Streptomyces TaxID=2593676 RepID=UPI00339F13E7